MTVREFEYLDFIRRRDLAMYKKVLDMLNESVEDKVLYRLKPHRLTTEKRPLLRDMDSMSKT